MSWNEFSGCAVAFSAACYPNSSIIIMEIYCQMAVLI